MADGALDAHSPLESGDQVHCILATQHDHVRLAGMEAPIFEEVSFQSLLSTAHVELATQGKVCLPLGGDSTWIAPRIVNSIRSINEA